TNPDGQTAVGTGIFAIKKPNGATCGAGSECASGNCVGGICCSSACNCGTCGTGTCVAGGVAAPGTPSCSPYVCNAASTSCPTMCTMLADCAEGFFCSGGACMATRANGSACTAPTDCASGNCVAMRCQAG